MAILTVRRVLLLFCAVGLAFSVLMGWFITAVLFTIGIIGIGVRKGVDQ